MKRRSVAWLSYLEDFHAQQPGITEAVLARCTYNNTSPYHWVLGGIPNTAAVLDVACGSAPTYETDRRLWVGVDRSASELAAGQARGVRRLALADAASLPFGDNTFDTVVCAMALMLFAPLSETLREIHRVLRRHGTLHALLPATRPLTPTDRLRLGRLSATLHSTPRFPPSPLRRHAPPTFEQAGFSIASDEYRRYQYPLHAPKDAERLVESLYLPGVDADRKQRAARQAGRWKGTNVAIPLRKITATRTGPSHP